MHDPLAEAVTALVLALPAKTLTAIGAALGQYTAPSLIAQSAADDIAPHATTRALTQTLLAAWRAADGGVTGSAVATMLFAAGATADHLRNQGDTNIVWTGPATGVVPVRATAIVLRDLIDGGRTELLLVSFAAYKVPVLVHALQAAIQRGVTVTFVLESAIEAPGSLDVDARKAFATLTGAARFYTWPIARRPLLPSGRPAAVHAKCAIADRRVALIGSANLTGAALASNMELGLEIRGGALPGRLADHFGALISSGEVDEV